MKTFYNGLIVVIFSVGLWLGTSSTASAQTPVLFKSGPVDRLIAASNGVFFTSGGFWWKSDGTSTGTVLIKDSAGQPVSSRASSLSAYAVAGGRLYFSVLGPLTNNSIVSSTTSTLYYVDNLGIAQTIGVFTGQVNNLVALDDQLCFVVTSYEGAQSIWQTYGDGGRASFVVTLSTATGLPPIAAYKNQIYFLATKATSSSIDAYSTSTLWKIAGSPAAPVEVKDIPVQISNSFRFLQVANDKLYISGIQSGGYTVALYQSDGTATGTSMLANPPELRSYTDAYLPKVENNELYLIGYSSSVLRNSTGDLYKVSPGSNVIEEAKDVYGRLPAGVTLFRPGAFKYYKGLFYLSAVNSTLGAELWRSDGILIKDIQTGPGTSDPQNFFVANDLLYFNADGNFTGRELFSSDGTEAGTKLLADLAPGIRNSSPFNFITYNNEVYFTVLASDLYKIPNNTTTTPTPPATTGLALTTPTYDCTTGLLSLLSTGGNGQTVEYRIIGIRDWTASNLFTVPTYQRNSTSFTLEARQSGAIVSLPFTSACQSTTTTPPVNPPTATPLTVAAQTLNCQTGALQLSATGGDGTAIEFKVPGLRDYAASASFTVPTYQRQNTTFTLYARQSGKEVTASFTAACPVGARIASAETTSALEVVVYPNPVGEQFTVGVSGAAGQVVRFHLTNLNGQTVVEQRAQVESDSHLETLRVPASNAGMYLLQVSTETQSKTVKVLKP